MLKNEFVSELEREKLKMPIAAAASNSLKITEKKNQSGQNKVVKLISFFENSKF